MDWRQKAAGLLIGIFVGGQFLLFMIVAEALYPGYSVSHNYISDLGGVGRTAPVFNTSIILLGLALIAASVLMDSQPLPFRVLIALSGIGAAGVGIFPETTGIPHTIFSLIVFLFASLAPLALLRAGRRPAVFLWTAFGLVGLIASCFT